MCIRDRALIEASVRHKEESRKEFQKLDLSEGKPKILSYLLDHEGIPQRELAENCHVKPATITFLLEKMLADGLIWKKTLHISGGKRALGIYLTEEGRQLALRCRDIVKEMEIRSLQGFSEEEKETLILLLNRVSENLSH